LSFWQDIFQLKLVSAKLFYLTMGY